MVLVKWMNDPGYVEGVSWLTAEEKMDVLEEVELGCFEPDVIQIDLM